MKIIKKTIDIMSNMILFVLCVFLLITAPMIVGYKPVMVLSGSMEPTFSVGGIIYYKEVPFEDIDVGDPITFRAGTGGAMVTHRVVERYDDQKEFVTKGDANADNDVNPVQYDRVLGKTLDFCIPYAGYFVSYCRQIPVIVTLGAILILNVLLDMLFPKEKKGPDHDFRDRQESNQYEKED